ncbi:hypothetical protein KI387_022267 [Taxus chinensis]|uniref:Flavin-containing monooxygenase n=1 Tax=Taxus chinensis TaxID=29808 RepID=A0AA38L9V1_TAXCH|nr:hypothetical protein KI387_022267 [Taxus chinensis]
MWITPTDSSIMWTPYTCKSYGCLIEHKNQKGVCSKCKDCFDLAYREKYKWLNSTNPLHFNINQVLELKKGTIRIGVDIGGGTATFTVRMHEHNMTIVSSSMNLDRPFNNFIASRGMIPMFLTISQCLPFFNNTLDLIHSMHVLSNWIPTTLLNFVLYDIDRVLLLGGIFWLDHFFYIKSQLDVFMMYNTLLVKKQEQHDILHCGFPGSHSCNAQNQGTQVDRFFPMRSAINFDVAKFTLRREVEENSSPKLSAGKKTCKCSGWKLCVIGAGPAGLIAARELTREGHSVIVYEQNHDVGGIWLYDARVENDDPLGLNPHRKVHSSLYASLRLNSSRETMGFSGYPFVVKEGRDGRRFPSHRELLLYLKDFTQDFNLLPLISFNTWVEYVGMLCEENHEGGTVNGKNVKWMVRCRRKLASLEGIQSEDVIEQVFDGVVVCNGHYTQPRIPQIPGMHTWPGKQIHSHNYRVPDPFYKEVVVIIGNSQSGQDISLELLSMAKEVHLSSKSLDVVEAIRKIRANHQNFYIQCVVKSLHDNGLVVFQDGSSIIADSIIHCTGYSYSFPFLDTKGIVTVDDDRVGPLYEHIFPPLLAPSLSFVGIPRKIIAFPFFESQSKWIAQILSGKLVLPSIKDMIRTVEKFYEVKDIAGLPKRYTHDIGEFEYCDWVADQCGYPRLEEWRKQICLATLANADSNLETFRDSWDDQDWLDLALSTQLES